MNKCDIIIPIYNAYDCLTPCIDSVIKNTKFDGNRLILINDCSPDNRVLALLKKYKKKHEFIDVYDNKENLGFVGTVNKGMKLSSNDVVLLNSDTEVTKNWLLKMQTCAYSDDSIATVTPLSNNATLASVPKIFEANDLPKGLTLKEMGQIVETASYNDYPEIPTGHGFCLFIKRTVLDEIGFFDEKTFGKGYGEENDFCFRCLDYGYKNVLCDNTYIYHKESQSFSENKIALMKNGREKLRARYPIYQQKSDNWCVRKPIKYIGENIKLNLFSHDNKRLNILFIIHDWKNIKNNLGGTTLHAYDIIKNLRHKYNFHVLAPEDGIFKVYSYCVNSENVINYNIDETFNIYNFNNKSYRKLVSDIVNNYDISFVHIHHLKGHYFDAIDVFKEKKIKYTMSLHDFYCICPLITMFTNDGGYCNNFNTSKCNECIKENTNVHNNMIDNWRKKWAYVLENAEYIVAPSDSCKKTIQKVYKNIDIEVIEHGIDLKKMKMTATMDNSKNINVAIIGAIGIHKGMKLFDDVINKSKYKNITFHLFGIIDSKDFNTRKNFINHGKYKRNDIQKLVSDNKIDLICLMSMCPETYSYTLSEAVACGVPVIATNLGALNERIEKYNLGWIVDYKITAKDFINKIYEIRNNLDDYNNKIKSISKYNLKSINDMANDYDKLYELYLKNHPKVSNINFDELKEAIKLSKHKSNTVIYNNYEWVFDTLKWKLISKIKIPRKIKNIYRKLKK